MKRVLFLLLMTISAELVAENAYRSWGGSQMYDRGLQPKQYGFKGRYSPWENIEDYKKGFDDQVIEHKSDPYVFGKEKPELEWYSDERMGRASKEKANSEYFKKWNEYIEQERNPYKSQYMREPSTTGGGYERYNPYGYSPLGW